MRKKHGLTNNEENKLIELANSMKITIDELIERIINE